MIRIVSILVLLAGVAFAAPAGADPHAALDLLLQRYVDDDGRVAYRDLGRQDGAALDAYLEGLAAADPDAWPELEQIAFWINAYNARVLRGVLDGQRAESLFARDWTLNAQPGQRPE